MDIRLIKELAQAKRYTIASLERECAFTPGTIKRWKEISPGIDKVMRVADVLECSIDELCGRTYYVEQAEKRTDAALENMLLFQQELNATRSPDDLSDDERRIVRVFRSLSDPDKVQFLFQILKFNDSKEK